MRCEIVIRFHRIPPVRLLSPGDMVIFVVEENGCGGGDGYLWLMGSCHLGKARFIDTNVVALHEHVNFLA